jgi:hypothetical protein
MWASKTLAVPDSYKRCTPWLELETCYADLKLFIITLRSFLEDLAVLFAKGENQKPIIFIYYIILVEMEGVKAKLNWKQQW